MVVHRRSNHNAWCMQIVKACYYAFVAKFFVLVLIWWFWGKILDNLQSDRFYFWRNYILMPALVELCVTSGVHAWLKKRRRTMQTRRYVVLLLLVFFCVFFILVYSGIVVLFCSFILPIFVSTIFSDWKILRNISLVSFALLPCCAVAVQQIAEHGPKLWMEMWAAMVLLLSAYMLARILMRFNRDNLACLRASFESQVDLEEMLRHDLFTGLLNRTVFDRVLPAMMEKCRKEEKPLTVALLDMDDFKLLNDNFGHAHGDEVLLVLSEILLKHERDGVIAFRYGGEEFTLLFEGIPPERAKEICETMQMEMLEECMTRYGCQITFSCGLAGLSPDIKDSHELFRLADLAMYEAKTGGKNKIALTREKTLH